MNGTGEGLRERLARRLEPSQALEVVLEGRIEEALSPEFAERGGHDAIGVGEVLGQRGFGQRGLSRRLREPARPVGDVRVPHRQLAEERTLGARAGVISRDSRL